MKEIIVLFILFISFNLTQAQIDSICINIIFINNTEFILDVNNKSPSSIYIPEYFVLQETSDTLWVDNQFKFERTNSYKYVYHIGDSSFVLNRQMPGRLYDSILVHKSEMTPFSNPFGTLLEIKSNEIIQKKGALRFLNGIPSTVMVSIFSSNLPSNGIFMNKPQVMSAFIVRKL